MIYKLEIHILVCLFIASCGSAKFVPTTDICSLEKHWNDSLYQVKINDKRINKHWYLKDDAIDITNQLADINKCMAN
ncbi:hypothetical protein [Halobacteriovorax sp.]|uniref:hypothetical protein n=1 Tax=Halobacteriovorax sp. TaxID=2020862 RepID=UPI00356245F5